MWLYGCSEGATAEAKTGDINSTEMTWFMHERTNFIIRGHDLISDLEIAVLRLTYVQDIPVIYLDVRHFKLGNTIYDDASGVVFLSA